MTIPDISPRRAFKPVAESLSNQPQKGELCVAVLTGEMSYGSFRTHVGRSGDMSDTA